MITSETVYYTCLNNDCEKHRSIFVEGDPLHAECKRERLELAGQERRTVPAWLWFAVPAAVTLAAAAVALYRRRAAAPKRADRAADLRGHTRQTWSGSHSHVEEQREGKSVPPPIS